MQLVFESAECTATLERPLQPAGERLVADARGVPLHVAVRLMGPFGVDLDHIAFVVVVLDLVVPLGIE